MATNSKSLNFDVAVLGAGSSGATAAVHFADAGFKVALIEAKPLNDAGSQWVNGVPLWMFEMAGITSPQKDEKRHGTKPIIFLSKSNKTKIKIAQNKVVGVDMRLLQERLHNSAIEKGATIFESTKINAIEFDDEQISYLTILSNNSNRNSIKLKAKLYIDATGYNGFLRRKIPALNDVCPFPPLQHLCDATQEVYKVTDENQCRAFLDIYSAQSDEMLSWVGVDGGFSSLNLIVSKDFKTVGVLTGSVADGAHASSLQLLNAFKNKELWIGEKLFGGSGLIPLRRPYDCLAMDGVALVGASGCQIFPSHGSGVGSGMIAAKILLEAVIGTGDLDSPDMLWKYQADFQRRLGKLHAFYDIFRRTIQNMTGEEIEELLESGLMTHSSLYAGLVQEFPHPDVEELEKIITAALRNKELVKKLITPLIKMGLIYKLYSEYPTTPNELKLKLWSKAVAAIFNEEPDIS